MDDIKEGAPKSKIKPEALSHKPKGFKIALIALAALIVLFGLTLYFLPHFLPIGTIRGIAKAKAREVAGVDLEFGDLRFGWNGDLVIDNITVSPLGDGETPGEALLTIKEARTNVALMPLLSGKAIVNSFDMEGFVLNVRREADGTLNLPDFSRLSENARASAPAPRNRQLLSAVTEAPASGSAIPPIELHQLNFKDGVISYVDAGQDLNLNVGLDFLRVDGQSLEDPFVLSGRLVPYPDSPALGDLPFAGRVALLHNGEFNPDGEANLEVDVKNLSLHEMADKFGLGHTLSSARADGMIKAAYSGRKAAVNIPELRLTQTSIGVDARQILAVPDTTASLNAVFDPNSGNVQLDDLSLTNNLTAIRASGRIDGVNNLAQGVTPAAALDFSGAIDFAGTSHFLSSQNLLPGTLPELDGKTTFVGKAALPPQSGGVFAPTLSVDFNDGGVQAIDHNSGAVAALELKGVGVRAAANLSQETTVNAAVNLSGVPARAFIPALGNQPVTATLNGGAALDHSAQNSRVELRLENTQAAVPATPWSVAANINDAQARIIADLGSDLVQVQGLKATINNVLQGGIVSGQVSGLMAGNPNGQADLEFSGLVEHLKQFLAPVFPHNLFPTLNGSLRSATRVKIEGNEAEALIRGEMDNAQIVVNVVPGQSQAEVHTPKATMALLASVKLDAPDQIVVNSLEAAGNNADVQYTDVNGSSFRGQTGNTLVKAAGQVNADNGQFTNLTFDVNGMNLALGQGGQQVASLSSGILKIIAAAPEHAVQIPLGGQGEFNLPNINLGVDNLLFQFKEEQSNFGNVRARFAVDGYVGPEKRQLVNLRTVSLSAAPIAVNSRGQFDLGSGALLAEYAARVAPAAMSSLLGYLGLPPALLTDAAVSGTVSYNGSVVSSKGAAQGQLRTGSNETNPFEVAHDLSAAWNPGDRSLALDIRRLDGNVKTQAGEAVATMKAQQSKLLLSRAGSKGLLDIRFNGSADPTRHFLLGLSGLFPGFGSIANSLYAMQVGGVYNAWLQVRDKDPVTLGINAGSVWQGAALAIDGVPYVSEAAKLSAALEGDFAYQDNQLRLSRMLLRSDSGMMQADGTVNASLVADENNIPNGISHVEADLRFVMADIRKAAMVLPAVIPADLGLAGRIDGSLKAGGDTNDIRIDTGVVRFQNFVATPAPDLDVAIPNGAANFGGSVNLHMAGGGQGHPWELFRIFDVRNGQVAVTGMNIHGKAVNELSSAFQLQGGVVTLHSAKMSIGDGSEGSAAVNGTVDFNAAAPVVNARLSLQNIPLSEVNSEIVNYLQVESGVMNLPAQAGQAASVAFAGFDEDSILRTIRLDNFTFATGPVTMETGPALNAELAKARGIMKQSTSEGKSHRVSFSSITGTFQAAGDGIIQIPQEQPITLTGQDTGDFQAHGRVMANHTMDVRVMVTGKIENLIGFTIPNIVPNLASLGSGGSGETTNRLMATLNESAAKGKYGVNVRGPLASPDISGIGNLAGQFLSDILRSELLGGVLGLGKDVPAAIGNVVGGVVGGIVTNPGETLKNLPENIVKSPENVVKGLGQMFGIGSRNRDGEQQQEQSEQPQPQQQQAQPQQQQQQQQRPQDVLRGLGQMFGGSRNQQQEQQQDTEQPQQQQQRRPRLPFGIH